MKKNLRFVGLDVHKDSIAIAVADSGREPARLLESPPVESLASAVRAAIVADAKRGQ
jgi:hypothetical protein